MENTDKLQSVGVITQTVTVDTLAITLKQLFDNKAIVKGVVDIIYVLVYDDVVYPHYSQSPTAYSSKGNLVSYMVGYANDLVEFVNNNIGKNINVLMKQAINKPNMKIGNVTHVHGSAGYVNYRSVNEVTLNRLASNLEVRLTPPTAGGSREAHVTLPGNQKILSQTLGPDYANVHGQDLNQSAASLATLELARLEDYRLFMNLMTIDDVVFNKLRQSDDWLPKVLANGAYVIEFGDWAIVESVSDRLMETRLLAPDGLYSTVKSYRRYAVDTIRTILSTYIPNSLN